MLMVEKAMGNSTTLDSEATTLEGNRGRAAVDVWRLTAVG